MASINSLEIRFHQLHPGHSPAPIHKISGSTPQAPLRAEPLPISTTAAQTESTAASDAPDSSLGEIKIRAEFSISSSLTTPMVIDPAEAAHAALSRDTSCAQDSLGELRRFSRKVVHESTAKCRRFELLKTTTYTRAYNRAYERGGLLGTSPTIKAMHTGDLRENQRECTNDNCGFHTKGWTAEKTLFLAKTKLRREERDTEERLRLIESESMRDIEAELRQERLKALEDLESSYDQFDLDNDDSDWEDEKDDICIVTGN